MEILKEIDIPIYNKVLWVAVSNDGKELNGKYKHADEGCDLVFDERFLKFEAITAKVYEIESRNFGVLIVFRGLKYMNCRAIAHEASHAAGYLYSYMNEDIRHSDEPYSYLVGWIADCCWKIKTSKK